MKTGIITFHYANNYGAVLQAYALLTYLKNEGFEAQIIDYRNEYLKSTKKVFKPFNSMKNIAVNVATLKHCFSLLNKRRKFESFIEQCLDMTNIFSTYSSLEANPPEFDAYICGSDQIWNPGILFDAAYFLEFVRSGSYRKISYAASFGASEIDKMYAEKITDHLRRIKYLSVREQSGARIVEKLLNRESAVVLDPTFLIKKQDWDKLLSKHLKNSREIIYPYILCYYLEKNSLNQIIVNKVKRQTGYRVISIMTSFFNQVDSDIIVEDAGPLEFIQLFRDAAYVCTSSFHGTVFSIIFEKQFQVLAHSKTNSRLKDLLDKLELEERLIYSSEMILNSNAELDYKKVKRLLDLEIQSSSEFLKKALTSIINEEFREKVR